MSVHLICIVLTFHKRRRERGKCSESWLRDEEANWPGRNRGDYSEIEITANGNILYAVWQMVFCCLLNNIRNTFDRNQKESFPLCFSAGQFEFSSLAPYAHVMILI